MNNKMQSHVNNNVELKLQLKLNLHIEYLYQIMNNSVQ